MKILVCGDRRWKDRMAIYNQLAALKADHGHDLYIIEGGAEGADRIAWNEAGRLGITTETFPADWKRHGRAAGPIRNRQMLAEKPDLVLAFHDSIGRSRGTKDCVNEARRRGIAVRIVTSCE